ncbi:hypothetical protein Tco_0542571 [Tanacetum coccineum]
MAEITFIKSLIQQKHLVKLSQKKHRYPKDSGFELTAFSDADHAGCLDTRKSTSGGIQFLGDKLVSWMSKKQNCTAMSSAEAEYVALSASCAQVMWMRTQLQDYVFNYNKIPLYCDSQSAISISCNPVQHSRTKHIHTRYHFIKEQVENGIIELYFVRTEYQLADMFTKALPEDQFKYLVRRIGMRCLTPAELEDKEEPHANISIFPKITSTMKFPNVPSTSVKLMLFPFSLEGAARIWLEKEPPRSILTWDDLGDARIMGFSALRINSILFYNALNSNDQDSLNSAAGGNFLDKMPRECLKIIESKSKVRQSRSKAVVAKVSTSSSTPAVSPDVAELKDMVRALILDKKNQTPAPVKAVEQTAAANFNQGNTGYRPQMVANQIRPPGFPPVQNHQGNNQNNFNRGNNYNQNRGNNFNQSQIYRPQVNQPPAYQAPVPQTHGVSKTDFDNYVKANDAVLRNMQNQGQTLQNQMANLTDMLSKFVISNTASTSGSGTLPSNTVTNPKEDLKGITTRSGVAYQGPAIPSTSSSSPKVMNRDTEVTKDTMLPTNNGSTEDRFSTSGSFKDNLNPTSKPDVAPVSAPMPNQRTSIPFPSRRNDERRREKANDQIEKFYEIFRDLIASVILLGYDHYCLNSSPTLTPFGDSDFLLLEEANAFIAIDDEPISREIDATYYDPEGDILILEALLICGYLNEPPEVELKDLPPHLEYAFLEGNDKLPVIIAKDLKNEEKAALIEVLKSHKQAIAWKLSDIKGIDPEFCTHKILMEEDYEPTVQHQRRVNPKIHDVIKKEVEKLLDAGLIYPISDSPWGGEFFEDSFSTCLSHLEKMLKRCEDTNLALNWEKSHFMVKEGIVLGHKISKSGIEVDRAKVDVIAKLPHPTTVKARDHERFDIRAIVITFREIRVESRSESLYTESFEMLLSLASLRAVQVDFLATTSAQEPSAGYRDDVLYTNFSLKECSTPSDLQLALMLWLNAESISSYYTSSCLHHSPRSIFRSQSQDLSLISSLASTERDLII